MLVFHGELFLLHSTRTSDNFFSCCVPSKIWVQQLYGLNVMCLGFMFLNNKIGIIHSLIVQKNSSVKSSDLGIFFDAKFLWLIDSHYLLFCSDFQFLNGSGSVRCLSLGICTFLLDYQIHCMQLVLVINNILYFCIVSSNISLSLCLNLLFTCYPS